jgi:hypothetical protein
MLFPGQQRSISAALLTRDRYEDRVWNDPCSAAHRYAAHRVREKARHGGLRTAQCLRNATTRPVIGNPFLYSCTSLSIVSTRKPLALAVSAM